MNEFKKYTLSEHLKKPLTLIIAGLAVLLLILFSYASFKGASDGIIFWITEFILFTAVLLLVEVNYYDTEKNLNEIRAMMEGKKE